MAYHFFTVGKTSARLRRGYNIDFPVGLGARNRRDDVLLAQTFLRMVYLDNTNSEITELFPGLPGVDIVVDGSCGPVTHRYISRFKDQVRALGKELYPDACMDPFRDNDPFSLSRIAKREYAFGILLRAAAKADEQRFDGLTEHTETHPSLKLALTQTRDDALQYSG
ncbi:MAG TPA: hypothetical protein VFI92_08365 [Steroidobacteraceae bacterium]|nr:hypothetical protein [Steroidobacteraceae bacterium]